MFLVPAYLCLRNNCDEPWALSDIQAERGTHLRPVQFSSLYPRSQTLEPGTVGGKKHKQAECTQDITCKLN